MLAGILVWTIAAFGAGKIDASGQYLPFNGVTVVSFFKSSAFKQVLHPLHSFMSDCELIQPFCALLPEDSWHLTTHNLWVESSFSPNAWNGFIEDNLGYFKKLSKRLEALHQPFEATYVDLYVGSVIQLLFTIPPDWTEKLRKVGSEFDVTSGIPAQMHATLCYFHKDVKPEQMEQITKAIKEKIESLNVQKPLKLDLKPPTLTYFKSMKEFIPWDGEKHPFVEEKKEVKKRIKNIFRIKKDPPPASPSPTPSVIMGPKAGSEPTS